MSAQPPPANQADELAYLANTLMVQGYLDEHPLDPQDIYDPHCREAIEVAIDLHGQGRELDAPLLGSELRDRGCPDDARARLQEALALPLDVVGDYEVRIRRNARRRRNIAIAREFLANNYDRTQDVDAISAGLCSDIEAAGADHLSSVGAANLRVMLADSQSRAVQRSKERARRGNDAVELSTGNWELDRDTGGFRPGTVAVFGAQSHWGKSSYALMVADLAINRGHNTLIVSAEDPESLWADRWLQYRAEIPRERFDAGVFLPDHLHRMTRAAHEARDTPVLLDATGRSPEWTARQVRALVRKHRIKLVQYDYITAWLKGEKSAADMRPAANHITRTFSDLGKQLGVATLLYSQITPSDTIGMYSLRESKDIANGAEVVLLGLKDKKSGDRSIKLAKNKPGPAPMGKSYAMGTNQATQSFKPVEASNWHKNFEDDFCGL